MRTLRKRKPPRNLIHIWGAIIGAGQAIGNNMAAEERQNDAQEFAQSQQAQTMEYNAWQAAAARDFNREEAARQRSWEQDMSGSAYQRAVVDLQKAGLNPMLAYSQGGAKAGHGAAATGGAASTSPASSGVASPGGGPDIMSAWHSASQVDLNAAAQRKIDAETDLVKAQEGEVTARTPTHTVSIQVMQQSIRESEERIQNIRQQVQTGAATASHLNQQIENLREAIPQIRATVNLLKAQSLQATAITGKSIEETREIQQRIKANLPAAEAALRELEAQARVLDMPRREQDRAAHDRFTGSLGALIRSLTGIGTYLK